MPFVCRQVDTTLAHVKVGTNVSWHKSDHDQLSQMHCSASELVVGTAPPNDLTCGAKDCDPSSLNISPWQQALLSTGEPMPLHYTLASIDALLTSAYFPVDPDIAKKQLNLQQFLQNDYCHNVPGSPTARGAQGTGQRTPNTWPVRMVVFQ